MDDALAAKLISLAVLGLCSIAAGCVPLATLAFLRRGRRGSAAQLRVSPDSPVFSFFLCFGAGVLLATLLCHMIPESIEAWEDIQSKGYVAENDVQLPSILVGVGFFLVYLVEELAHRIIHGAQRRAARKTDVALQPVAELSAAELEERHGHAGHAGDAAHLQDPAAQGYSHGAALGGDGGVLTTILLLVALSFHAILEGIAIGAEQKASGVYLMLAAVSAHKFILVFILGLELLATPLRTLAQVGCVATFAAATMLGIAIGIGVLQLEAGGKAHDISLMVMQTLACGTLMYVCFMEILTRERGREGHAMARFACTLAGFVLLSLLVSLITEPEEDDDGDSTASTVSALISSTTPLPPTTK